MSDNKTNPANFTVGLDVGSVGRWSRLVWGVLILLASVSAIFQGSQGAGLNPTFYGIALLYFIGITAGYVAAYWLLGERLLAQGNPWINTLILVGPAVVAICWNFVILPSTGIELPAALSLAVGAYIGISLLLQWQIKYGGCEVVALPIIILKRRYTTYCVALVALDAVEKQVRGSTRGN